MEQTPFAMTFEQIKAQADANMQADKGQAAPSQSQAQAPAQAPAQTPAQSQAQSQAQEQPQEQAPAGGATFLDMVAKAERDLANEAKAKEQESAVPVEASAQVQTPAEVPAEFQTPAEAPAEAPAPAGGITFDNLYAQAAGGTQASTFESLFAQAKDNEGSNQSAQAAAAPESPAASGVPSFDNLLKQTKEETEAQAPAEAGISFENIMNPVQEAPAAEAPAQEAPAQETPKAEAPAQEAPTAEEPAQEVPKAKKTGSKKGKKKTDVEEEQEEPLPDITNDYKVDVLGEGKAEESPAPAKTEGQTLSMEGLFTPEEIEAFRADIRTFVRKEFKQAMVGVMKELLAEFNE